MTQTLVCVFSFLGRSAEMALEKAYASEMLAVFPFYIVHIWGKVDSGAQWNDESLLLSRLPSLTVFWAIGIGKFARCCAIFNFHKWLK